MLTVPGVNVAIIELSMMKKFPTVAMVESFQMVHVNKTYIFLLSCSFYFILYGRVKYDYNRFAGCFFFLMIFGPFR